MIIKIANLLIKVSPRFFNGEVFFRDYIVGESCEYDIDIVITEEDMEVEKGFATPGNLSNLGLLEKIAIFRKICLKVLEHDAFFLHSSVVVVDDKAYAFAAKSGTGKSTHTNLWLEHFQDRSYIINGDKPIYRFLDETLYVCGHPWGGKEGLHRNAMAPLAGLCFLSRGEENSMRKLDNEEVLEHIFRQILLPQDESLMVYLLDMVDQLISEIPCYLLKCNVSMEAVEIAYNGMKKNER